MTQSFLEKKRRKNASLFHHDFSRAKKKPTCLDDRDTDSPLDKDRDTIIPGPEERSSRPGQ